MKPILLIHGYSSEGRDRSAEDIYGSLPDRLRDRFGDDGVVQIDLSRWISLQDGITIDDIALALERALNQTAHRHLLQSGFHAVVHSTGALVIRDWLRLYSPRPSPLANLVHLAGANFGSGLAHVGRGKLAKWGRLIFHGTGRGLRVLEELELGSNKTLDLHLHFREPGNDLRHDYEVQEFAMIGSQTLPALRLAPIRYVKEDSSDNTVRVAASNLNFNHIVVEPTEHALELGPRGLARAVETRLEHAPTDDALYRIRDLDGLADAHRTVPFALLFETSHTGDDIGIVHGADNRDEVEPLLFDALTAPLDDEDGHAGRVQRFMETTRRTLERATTLERRFEWDEQSQYEAHAMLVLRIRDQFGVDVAHHDVTVVSGADRSRPAQLARMIEDEHVNGRNRGTTVFWLRVAEFWKRGRSRRFVDRLAAIDEPTLIEITGEEPASPEIEYVPFTLTLTPEDVRSFVTPFATTVIDVTLVRLPSRKVFAIKRG